MTEITDWGVLAPPKIKLTFAADAAAKLCVLLGSACEEIVVAGSVRRAKADVKDVELVAVPLAADAPPDLFALSMADMAAAPLDPFAQKSNCLDQRIERLIAEKTLEWDDDLKRRGQRYKRLKFAGIPIDLFLVERASFGYQLAIRTGPAAYSKQLVTSDHYRTSDGRPGLLSGDLRVSEGAVYCRERRVAVRTEADFFRVLGLTWVAPEDRR